MKGRGREGRGGGRDGGRESAHLVRAEPLPPAPVCPSLPPPSAAPGERRVSMSRCRPWPSVTCEYSRRRLTCVPSWKCRPGPSTAGICCSRADQRKKTRGRRYAVNMGKSDARHSVPGRLSTKTTRAAGRVGWGCQAGPTPETAAAASPAPALFPPTRFYGSHPLSRRLS